MFVSFVSRFLPRLPLGSRADMIRSSSGMPFGLPAAVLAVFLVSIFKAGLGSFQFSTSVTLLKVAQPAERARLLEKCLK